MYQIFTLNSSLDCSSTDLRRLGGKKTKLQITPHRGQTLILCSPPLCSTGNIKLFIVLIPVKHLVTIGDWIGLSHFHCKFLTTSKN